MSVVLVMSVPRAGCCNCTTIDHSHLTDQASARCRIYRSWGGIRSRETCPRLQLPRKPSSVICRNTYVLSRSGVSRIRISRRIHVEQPAREIQRGVEGKCMSAIHRGSWRRADSDDTERLVASREVDRYGEERICYRRRLASDAQKRRRSSSTIFVGARRAIRLPKEYLGSRKLALPAEERSCCVIVIWSTKRPSLYRTCPALFTKTSQLSQVAVLCINTPRDHRARR